MVQRLGAGHRDSTNGRFYFRWGDGGGSSFCCETTYDWAIGDHYEAFTADINANGCGDIGLRDPNNGDFYVHYGNCNGGFGGQTQFDWAPGYHYRPFVCDVNGNGYPDVGLFDPYNGKFYVKYGNGSGQFYGQTDWYWTVGAHYQPFARDFNLDGRCDIGLRDPNNGAFYIRWGNGDGSFGNQAQYDWGAPGYHYVPFTIRISIQYHWGDIGLRDPNNGRWYFRKGNGSGGFCCQTEFPWAPT